MKNSYKSIQVVELLETKSDNDHDNTCTGENGYIDCKSTDMKQESKQTFTTEVEKRSFNAMISLKDIDTVQISTIEHKICGITGFIVSILIIIILSYGELSYWKHSSYIMDKSHNITTKIYNTSFTVTCSWHALHYKQTIPQSVTKNTKFNELCNNNVPHSCALNATGTLWFILLFVVMILLFMASLILIYPVKLCKLKYIKYLFLFCGLLIFISVIPITMAMNSDNDICGNKDYCEWDDYNGYIENHDSPLWTIYLLPPMAILLWLSACFLAQIRDKVDLSHNDLFL